MKKLLKKLSLAFLITALITTQTQAAFNTQNLAGTTLASAGALTTVMALATGTAVALTGGLALGLFGVALLISNNANESSTPTNSPITIYLDPAKPLITPQGWTNPNTPPQTQAGELRWTQTTDSNSTAPSFTTSRQAFDYHLSQNPAWTESENYPGEYVINANQSNYYMKPKTSVGTQYGSQAIPFYKITKCPTGYTFSSNTCNMTNQAAVKKPIKGVHEIKRVGNTFQTDPLINPADIVPPVIATITSDTVTVKDDQGRKTTTKINTDGTTTITVNQPNHTNNTTTNTTINMSAPSTGNPPKVTGIATSITNGTGDLQEPPSNGGGGSELDISSLNKESTQQAIKLNTDEIKNALKCDDCELPEDVTEANQTKINDEIKKSTGMLEKVNEDYAGFKDLGWSNWVPTFPSSACSPINGDIAGQHVSWDFCPHIAKLNELLGWLMNLFGAWTITGMFFKRE